MLGENHNGVAHGVCIPWSNRNISGEDMNSKPLWGPFAKDPLTLDNHELRAQLRSLATLCYAHVGPSSQNLVLLLRKAEFCQDYMPQARDAFDALSPLLQRKIISTFNTINHWLPSLPPKKPIKHAPEPETDQEQLDRIG